MIRRPPRSTRTDTLFPYTTLFRSVPRALFLDRRLTPLERNAWQVFRLQLNDDGVTAFPTYDQLRPYLASMPCASQASHERSEERRVGKECVSTCRSRWSPYH